MAKYQRYFILLFIGVIGCIILLTNTTNVFHNVDYKKYIFTSKTDPASALKYLVPLSKSGPMASKASNLPKGILVKSPKSPPVNSKENAPVKPLKNPFANPPKNTPVKPTKNPSVKTLKNPFTNPPKNTPVKPPKNPSVKPLKNPFANPPKNPIAKRPKNPIAKRLKNPSVKPPKNTPVKPPKNPSVKPPKNPIAKRPKNPSVKPPKNPIAKPLNNPFVVTNKITHLPNPKNNPPVKPPKYPALNHPNAAALNPPENPTLTPVKSITSNTLKTLASVPQAVSHRKKYLIYRCSGSIGASYCSGLGNRQIGIVASFLLANATGRRFGVIMNHPCKFDKFMIPNSYNWMINPEEITGLMSTSLYVRNNRQFTNSLTTIDFNKNYPHDVVYIRTNHEYHVQLLHNKLYRKNLKWVSGLPKHLIYRTVLNRLFKLHPNVQKKKDAFFQMARPSPNSKLMCAQVRMGKNPTIPWDNKPMNSLKGVQNLWDFLDKRDKVNKVFVTSDSDEVVRNAKQRFGARFVTTSGPIIHIDKAYRGSVCEGMEKLVLDQMILVECDTLVVSVSSFSRIPAFLKTTPGLFLFRGGRVIKW